LQNKNDFGQEGKNICQKNSFTQFSKEKILKSFFILEILVFSELRPKNSAPETQPQKLSPRNSDLKLRLTKNKK
jgi:hypothetical protein